MRTKTFKSPLSLHFTIAAFLLLAMIVNISYFTFFLPQDQVDSCRCYQINSWPEKKSEENTEQSHPRSKKDYENNSQTLKDQEKNIDNVEQSKMKEDSAWIEIEGQSDKKNVFVTVNKVKVYEIDEVYDAARGMHAVVLNQHNGNVMTNMVFDFYGGAENSDLVKFLNSLKPGRIVVFLVKDDGGYGLKKSGRYALKAFGCRSAFDIGFRDQWVCIGRRDSHWVSERLSKYRGEDKWPAAVKANVALKLSAKLEENEMCNYNAGHEGVRRKLFCQEYEGYGDVCDCNNHESLYKTPAKMIGQTFLKLPVVIIASKRPHYLLRMLRKLLSVPGTDPASTTVFIDGHYNETIAVAELFGLKFVINEIECTQNCRIQQHYKKSLSFSFDAHPTAKAVIILEEDLEVSEDIFDYFTQTFPLLESDPSVYCISAWNDQGYQHAVHDSSLLYRVETMPGLGWILSRNLYKNELEKKWPGEKDHFDWDIWLRMDENRKGRECIIPDISRTYHFGAKGLNVNNFFQRLYFKTRALNTKINIKFDIEKMKKDNYENELAKIISNAEVLNYTKSSCKDKDDIVPDTKGKNYLLFIKMEKKDKYQTWMELATCFKLWDLDVRDFHNGLIRFWIKDNHIIIIGTPDSDYAFHKPKDIHPVEIKAKKRV